MFSNIKFPLVLMLFIVILLSTLIWAQTTIKITIIGDSTVCNYAASKYPQTGWGQVLSLFFVKGSVSVNNRAIGGRSTRSFYQEGRWAEIVPNLQKSEYVFIQFGHNDRDYSKKERYTDTTDYKEYLRKYVKEARAKGAIPVLISPMNMNAWNGASVREVFCEGANNYRGAMLNVANELGVPFIDLEKKSVNLQKKMGQNYCAKFIYLGLDPGEYANFPDGVSDGTHFQEMGANVMAMFVCEGISELKSNAEMAELAALLKPQYKVNVSVNKSNAGMITESGISFPEGVSVTLKVKPITGEKFLGWVDSTGKYVSTLPLYQFIMKARDVSCSARFQGGAEQHTLSTTVAAGGGLVSPSGGTFDDGSVVSLTAIPSSGWLFDYWSGDATGSENPLKITMKTSIDLIAHFIKDTATYYTVNSFTEGGGIVVQEPSTESLPQNTKVTFSAVPNRGWKFTGWKGTYTGSDSVYTIQHLSTPVNLDAEFMPVNILLYEAEYGKMFHAILENENQGFSGIGYINLDNITGSAVEIPVYADQKDERTVSIHYSNGSTAVRTVSVILNADTVSEPLNFSSTVNWTTWAVKDLELPLNKGINTIKLISVSAEGGPNIDRITIEPSSPTVDTYKNRKKEVMVTYSNYAICFINGSATNVKLTLFSVDGRRILRKEIQTVNANTLVRIPVPGLDKGTYILRLATEGTLIVKALVCF